MGLIKFTGVPQESAQDRDHRRNLSDPKVNIYSPAQIAFQLYAAHFLALTMLKTPGAVAAIKQAIEKITTPVDKPWTKFDAQAVLKAVGVPPMPSYVYITRVPGEAVLLARGVGPHHPMKQPLSINGAQARVAALELMREEGYNVEPGMCMEVPVKLVEDDYGLAVGLFLTMHDTRPLTKEESKK